MISQDQLLKTYDQPDHPYYLLDVRTPFEYQDHHLPGSVNIPVEQLEERIQELPKDKPIVCLCEHGVRSGVAAEFLRTQGYKSQNLEGGLSIWKGQLESSQS